MEPPATPPFNSETSSPGLGSFTGNRSQVPMAKVVHIWAASIWQNWYDALCIMAYTYIHIIYPYIISCLCVIYIYMYVYIYVSFASTSGPRTCWHRKNEWWSSQDWRWSPAGGWALACRDTHLVKHSKCPVFIHPVTGSCCRLPCIQAPWATQKTRILPLLDVFKIISAAAIDFDRLQITSKLYFNTAPHQNRSEKHSGCSFYRQV